MQLKTAVSARSASPWSSIRSLWFPAIIILFAASPAFSDDIAKGSSGWQQRCAGIRTSYNPQTELRSDLLTLETNDPRWPAFLAWVQAQQLATSTLIGLRTSPSTDAGKGIVFRWAPGTPWEQEVVIPFGQALAHLLVEREWRDLDFPQFFTSRGGMYGINLAERLFLLDPHSLTPWQQFFQAITAPSSPSAPLRSGRLSAVAPDGQSISMTFGANRVVPYSAARLSLDLRSILSDCSVYSFFQLYDQQHGAPPVASQQSPAPAASSPKAQSAVAVTPGRTVYDRHCSGCHGVNGDGKGLLATSLRPPPRDFTQGLFRYRSTPTGQLPTDEDLLRTVTAGLPGSLMPAWEPFLNEAERQAVVAYLKQFSPRFAPATPRDVLPLPSPPAATAEGVAQGEKLYRDSGCGSCHGDTGKGDGRSGKDLKTAEGNPIVPRDLTNKWSFHGGHTPQDVFQRLSTGMDGSPMASYRDVFSPTDLWNLIFYILSLSPPERPQLTSPSPAG
ncbi:MAG: c-type cytochrome [Deltaproteobacteria bacterium]|nr:c-type cytochrome [Deltaproteobacteria bacterium]